MRINGRTPASVLESYFVEWARKDTSLGFVLVLMVIIAMVWANSPWAESYHALWEVTFTVGFGEGAIKATLHQWINDALMAHFFFLVGLEIKREVINGELTRLV